GRGGRRRGRARASAAGPAGRARGGPARGGRAGRARGRGGSGPRGSSRTRARPRGTGGRARPRGRRRRASRSVASRRRAGSRPRGGSTRGRPGVTWDALWMIVGKAGGLFQTNPPARLRQGELREAPHALEGPLDAEGLAAGGRLLRPE